MNIGIFLLKLLMIIENNTELPHVPRKRNIIRYPRSLEHQLSFKHVYLEYIKL